MYQSELANVTEGGVTGPLTSGVWETTTEKLNKYATLCEEPYQTECMLF